MYILQNALRNLGRNKGRNILLGFIIFALILSTTVALVINSTTRGIIDDYKARFGSKVTFSVDFDQLMAGAKPNANGVMEYPTAPEITPKQYVAFAESEYLNSYQMTISNRVGLQESLNAVGDTQDGTFFVNEEGTTVVTRAKLMSCPNTDNMPDFAEGLRKITDGRLYQEQDECIISADFAALNNLKIGDSLSAIDGINGEAIPLTIVGIYADATQATSSYSSGAFVIDAPYTNRRNEIFVSMETMMAHFNIHNVMEVDAEYELKSPDLVDEFETEVREKGLPDIYNVGTDVEGYNKIVAPVEGLSKISMTFMLVVLIVGGIILLFITTMAIRERKYEIGVLRAMGMKKAKVAVMLVAETIMITGLCLAIGLGVGSMLSQPVADVLIAGQIEASDSGSVDSENGATELSEINVSLTPEAIGQITSVALLLALLSSAAGVAFITRYEPMRILSERN